MRQLSRQHDIRGVSTVVYDTGSPLPAGPPHPSPPTVVMVHGGDVRSMSTATDWSTIWDPVAVGARLISYDKPGQGGSYSPGMPAEQAMLPGLVAHLEALVEGAGSPVVLMGHSRGALPAAMVAQRRPDLVSGLVLVSSNTLAPAASTTPGDFYLRAYADPPDVPDDEYVRRELTMNSFDSRHVDLGIVAARRASVLASGWWADRAHRLRLYPQVEASLRAGREEFLARLERSRLNIPVLLFWGQNDVSAPTALGDELRNRLMASSEDVTAITVNRCGHYVYREHPQAFIAQLGLFLDSHFTDSAAHSHPVHLDSTHQP